MKTDRQLHQFRVQVIVHDALKFFLGNRAHLHLHKILHERTSVKDAIESHGIPHPEVDLILVDNTPVDFAFVLDKSSNIELFGVGESPSALAKARLQSRNQTRFLADGHLGKLTRQLRSLGIDVSYDRTADDRSLLELMQEEDRALLTRDRRLLMHSVVRHGYFPRSQNGEEQVREVIRRFDLGDKIAPLTRCPHCNTPLITVSKSQVEARLEPLTRRYYDHFRLCPGCQEIFWRGSHFQKLEARNARLMNDLVRSDR